MPGTGDGHDLTVGEAGSSAWVAAANVGRLAPPRTWRTGWRTLPEPVERGRRSRLDGQLAGDRRRRRDPQRPDRVGPVGARCRRRPSRRPGAGTSRAARRGGRPRRGGELRGEGRVAVARPRGRRGALVRHDPPEPVRQGAAPSAQRPPYEWPNASTAAHGPRRRPPPRRPRRRPRTRARWRRARCRPTHRGRAGRGRTGRRCRRAPGRGPGTSCGRPTRRGPGGAAGPSGTPGAERGDGASRRPTRRRGPARCGHAVGRQA